MTCIRLMMLFVMLLVSALQGRSQSHSVDIDPYLLKALNLVKEFVAIPNFGLDQAAIEENIDWLTIQLKDRGFVCQRLTTSSNPLLFAQRITSAELPTILLYMHVDGQAVDESKWEQENPYQVVLKAPHGEDGWLSIPWDTLDLHIDHDWRLFGRSAADDKGPIAAFLSTIDWLDDAGIPLRCNVKLIFDGEEELGSQGLPGVVDHYKDLFEADALIINDGPVHLSGLPTITFGCRGIMTVNLTVYGPIHPQHSGHYGNYAPNPAFRLAQLLATMKDAYGKVTIEGYYDGIEIDSSTKELLQNVPDDEGMILDLLQIAQPERVGTNYQESLQFPSLNIRGLSSAWVGPQARTIVPDHAIAAIDIRLVPESEPDRIYQLLEDHIRTQGYHIVQQEPTPAERRHYSRIAFLRKGRATLPFRTDPYSPVGEWLEQALYSEFKEPPVMIRMMGGTVPISSFIRALDLPAVIVPMVNADNNQHSPNENLRIGHMSNALRTFRTIFTIPFR